MSAMSRRTREQDELAEQLAAILREANERLRLWGRCSDTNCQRERICCGDADQCGTRVAPELGLAAARRAGNARGRLARYRGRGRKPHAAGLSGAQDRALAGSVLGPAPV